MPTGSELNDHAGKAYDAVMRDGTVPAVAREAIKDVRNMFMEFFFGKGERGQEPGTPLSPLFHDIVEARKSHGSPHGGGPQSPPMEKGSSMNMNSNQPTPSPSQIIDNPTAYLPERQGQQQGNAMGQDKGQGSAHGNGGQVPTPSQIIDNPTAYLPEPQHGHEQQHGHEHEHGRGM